jgi:hypothetical protein
VAQLFHAGSGVEFLVYDRGRFPTFPKHFTRPGFRVGLIGFHSQLLTESLLISFAPLIYMLKFRETSAEREFETNAQLKTEAFSWATHNPELYHVSRPVPPSLT